MSVAPKGGERTARMMWGTTRALVANMVQGVSAGYTKTMEIQGTGFRAAVTGPNLVINLGFSHDVVYPVPEGHHDHHAAPDGDHRDGRRQASGRAGCGRDPRLSSAGAVQGQGRAIRQRVDPPQGRQEEMSAPKDLRERRRERLRYQLKQKSGGRVRLSVFRSGKHIYAQIIDDKAGHTLARGVQLGHQPARRAAHGRRQGCGCGGWQAGCGAGVGGGRHQGGVRPRRVFFTTAASRRWPMPPAKAGWRSRAFRRAQSRPNEASWSDCLGDRRQWHG